MADFKISQLPEVTNASSADYVILNSNNSQTNRIKAESLVQTFASTAAGVRQPILVNLWGHYPGGNSGTGPGDVNNEFKGGGGGFFMETTDGSIYTYSNTGSDSYDSNTDTRALARLANLFITTDDISGNTAIVTSKQIPIPAGCDAAIILHTWNVTQRSAISVGNQSDIVGMCNILFRLRAYSNKSTTPRWSPGGKWGAFITGSKMIGPRMAYTDYQALAGISSGQVGSNGEVKNKGGQDSISQTRAARLFFDLSTSNDPTKIIFEPNAYIPRLQHTGVDVSPGRLIVFPYNTNDASAVAAADALANYANGDDDDQWYEDNMCDFGSEDDTILSSVMSSRELKQRMIYLSTAIDETLRWDVKITGGTGADGTNYPADTVTQGLLEDALRSIFELKRSTITSVADTKAALTAIITPEVMAAVGVKFAFEPATSAMTLF